MPTPSDSPPAALAGGFVAQYRLVRSLGRGSFGEVFEAAREDGVTPQKRVVLKRLSNELAKNAELVSVFMAAAELAMRLGHANILQVLDVARDADGTPFVVTEIADGISLATLMTELRRSGDPTPVGLSVLVGAEIAKALDHAHPDGRRHAIAHADLSPTNVFLTADGRVRVADFCIGDALLQLDPNVPALLGKWLHAAPERVRGERPSPKSDLFSLGVLLFELLSGQNPFERPGSEQVRRALASLQAAPSLAELRGDLPPSLVQLIESLLAPHPAARIASAARLHEALLEHAYLVGARYSSADLAKLVGSLEPARGQPSPGMREMFASVHDGSGPEIEIRYAALDKNESIPPPWSDDASTQETTILDLAFESDAPESALTLATTTLRRFGARITTEGPRGVTAIFGLDATDGRDAECAARAARQLTARLLAGGLGVSAGLCAARLRVDASGTPSDPAALAEALARASELSGRRGWAVADRRTARELRRSFELEPLGDGGRAWVIEEPRPEPRGELVGRRQLVQALAEQFESAEAGRLQLIGLVGAAGIGKTRLLNELVRRSSRGVGLALATCPPGGRHDPLSATDAMLRVLCGNRAAGRELGGASTERRIRAFGLNELQTASVLVRLGGSGERPLPNELAALGPVLTQMFGSLARDRVHLLAWDDAHELDRTTADLLASAISDLGDARLVLLFAARLEESAEYRRLPGYRELQVEELDERAARRLVALRLGVDRVPDRVFSFFFERAGGHPMFLEQLVHQALDDGAITVAHGFVEHAKLEDSAVPRTLRAAIASRLRRLPQPERDALTAAAILGEPIEPAVLAHMMEAPSEQLMRELDALEQRQLMRRVGYDQFGFVSPLLREVCASDLEPNTLAHLHRRAADAHQALADQPPEIAQRIAEHLERAGDARGAADHFHKSGMQQLRAGRFAEAVRELSRSIVLDESMIDAGELVLRISALAQASARTPAREGVLAAVEVARRELERLSSLDRRSRANVLLDLGKILGASDREADARGVLMEVVEQSSEWPELCRSALTAAAEIALRAGNFAEALTLSERAAGLGPGSPRERHRLLLTRAQALASVERHDDALDALELAAALGADSEPISAGERARTRAIIHAFRGDWQASADASEEAAEHGRSAGLTREVAANLHNQGEALIRLGDLARGYAALHASLAVAEESGSDRIANFDRLFLAYLDALDGLPGADEMLARCMALAADRGWTLDHLTGRFLLGKLLASRGELEAAQKELCAVRTRALELENRPLARDCSYELELFEPTIAEG